MGKAETQETDFGSWDWVAQIENRVPAIEVDGFHYHKEGTRQVERDRMKDAIFAKYGIPLLRLPTNGSGEIRKIEEMLEMAVECRTRV